MPSFTLYYFNARGRAEVIRMIFAIAEVPYNDKRVGFEDWKSFKESMPCSCLPVLELENRIQIPQSMAITRYLAREFGLYGKSNLEMARIDYICDSVYDILNDFMGMFYDKDGKIASTFGADMRCRSEKESMRLRYAETCRRILPFLEKTLEKHNNGDKFFMGEKITMADMMFFASMENPLEENPKLLTPYPKLTALRNRIAAHPNITSYMQRRDLTEF